MLGVLEGGECVLVAARPGVCELRRRYQTIAAGRRRLLAREAPAAGLGAGYDRMSATSGAAWKRIIPALGQRPDRGDELTARSYGKREVIMARHPLLGYLVWAVLFGALFAWEGLALARVTGVPTLSDVFRVIMRYPVGRWALFALWLWAGWHFFIRGWHFLLRA